MDETKQSRSPPAHPPFVQAEQFSEGVICVPYVANGCKASVLYGNSTIEATCLHFDKEEADNYYGCSLKIRSLDHFVPIIHCDYKKDSNLLFYPLFEPLQDKDLPWWKLQIKGLLRTLKKAHAMNIIHLGLDNPSNYVVQDSKLKLINFGKIWDCKSVPLPASLKKEDLRHFQQFLIDHWPGNRKGHSERFFYDFFSDDLSYEDMTNKLLGHPILLNGEETLQLYLDMDMAIDFGACNSGFLHRLRMGDEFDRFKSWDIKPFYGPLQQAMDYRSLHKSMMPYNGASIMHYVFFVRNARTHYIPPALYDDVASQLEAFFPNILSYLYRAFKPDDRFRRVIT